MASNKVLTPCSSMFLQSPTVSEVTVDRNLRRSMLLHMYAHRVPLVSYEHSIRFA